MKKTALLLILLLSISGIWAQEKWKLIENSDVMKIYTHLSEGSGYKELRISLVVNAPLSSIIAVLDDVPKYTEWIYTCKEAYIVEPKEDGKSSYYILMDLPWPISDRDVALKSKMAQDKESLEIKVDTKAAKGLVDEKKDVVRVPKNNIKWRIKPISKNVSHIDYYVKSSPGGAIPAWLVNMTVDVGPKKTMLALKERAEKTTVNNSYIKDFE